MEVNLTIEPIFLLTIFNFSKFFASPHFGNVRFLFTSGHYFRSDSRTFAPRFEYEPGLPHPTASRTLLHQSPQVSLISPPVVALTSIAAPFLQNQGIEQYQGERVYKRQRKVSSQFLNGYEGTTVGKALAYSLGPVGQDSLGKPHAQLFSTSLSNSVHEQPRYRYTQVGLSYGRQEEHHPRDGGYGPYDPHGTHEYEAATGPYRAFRQY
ncbi:hypothetical protein BIW11_07341 [Tropilaelaps mercedesae]|uniref:Uncharacterized protein n=1 Tax=Tropilaelaps mercedesae TaxID=418985 RepID=A0A1V9XUH8_9ACAR|nr:hypothetical protein BIW11_07341 [Tropilaelaps mercedesae]